MSLKESEKFDYQWLNCSKNDKRLPVNGHGPLNTAVLTQQTYVETYLGPCQTSTLKCFYKNSKRFLAVNYFAQKLHYRYLIEF